MNRVKAANDALAALLTSAFAPVPQAKFFRNPKGAKAWAGATVAIVMTDDKEPETLRTLSGPVYDLQIEPEVLIARRGAEADRAAPEWDDVEFLKTVLATDLSLGGAVEDVRLSGVENADLDTDQWIGGGLAVRIRLLFAAPTPAG